MNLLLYLVKYNCVNKFKYNNKTEFNQMELYFWYGFVKLKLELIS